jgi:hypothetical protein
MFGGCQAKGIDALPACGNGGDPSVRVQAIAVACRARRRFAVGSDPPPSAGQRRISVNQ